MTQVFTVSLSLILQTVPLTCTLCLQTKRPHSQGLSSYPLSSLVPGDDKMRDPGNETLIFSCALFVMAQFVSSFLFLVWIIVVAAAAAAAAWHSCWLLRRRYRDVSFFLSRDGNYEGVTEHKWGHAHSLNGCLIKTQLAKQRAWFRLLCPNDRPID